MNFGPSVAAGHTSWSTVNLIVPYWIASVCFVYADMKIKKDLSPWTVLLAFLKMGPFDVLVGGGCGFGFHRYGCKHNRRFGFGMHTIKMLFAEDDWSMFGEPSPHQENKWFDLFF